MFKSSQVFRRRFVVVMWVIGKCKFLLDDNRRGTARFFMLIASVASDAIASVVMSEQKVFEVNLHSAKWCRNVNSFGSGLF